jgi:hypothetical protein
MNKIQPYLFWIVAGGVVLIELIILVLMMPDVDMVGSKKAAQDAKASLDTEFKHLKQLDQAAQRGVPSRKYDAENPNDIKELTDDFLVTPAWTSVLESQVAQYDTMLSAIKSYLGNRSVPLGVPVAESNDKQVWYQTYEGISSELLRQLHEESRIILPVPSIGPTREGKAVDGPVAIDYASDTKAREVLGLYTKGADFPDPQEHALLTARFRVIEQILGSLRRAEIKHVANPVVESPGASATTHAQIVSLRWDVEGSPMSASRATGAMPHGMAPAGIMVPDMDPGGMPAAPGSPAVVQGDAAALELVGPIAAHATGRRLRLTLSGPLPTLMAAEAALEHGDPNGPVVVVTSFSLQRKATFVIGERKGVPSEVMTANINLLVLDFRRALEAVSTPAPSAPVAPKVGKRSHSSPPAVSPQPKEGEE